MTARAIPEADIVAYLREHGAADAGAIRDAFGCSKSTANRALEALSARHLLERAGTRTVKYLTTVKSNLYRVPPSPSPRGRVKKAGFWDGLLR